MRTPSVFIAEELMPYLRARVAEHLYSGGLTQAQIARYLGITQAMVSKYLSGRYRAPSEELAKKLDEIAEEVSELILLSGDREKAVVLVSRRLLDLFQNGFLCEYYSRYSGLSEEACRSIFAGVEGRWGVLEALNTALQGVLALEAFPSLIPEVRSNFAYSVRLPRNSDDVAAVPGRITAVKGKAFALPPEFGVSKFTAGILVEVSKIKPEVRSVLNIRYGKDVETALALTGFKVARVKTGGLDEDKAIKVIASVFENDVYDAVVDMGGLGVEPVVYIFGKHPFEVLEKLRKLVKLLGVRE